MNNANMGDIQSSVGDLIKNLNKNRNTVVCDAKCQESGNKTKYYNEYLNSKNNLLNASDRLKQAEKKYYTKTNQTQYYNTLIYDRAIKHTTNNNWNVPRNPTQLGGRRRKKYKKRYTKKNKKQRGGASLLRTIGLGDALQGYYSATDFATNTQNKWAGRKKITSSNPIRQPKMMKSASSQYRIPNVPEYHRLSSAKAAKHVLK